MNKSILIGSLIAILIIAAGVWYLLAQGTTAPPATTDENPAPQNGTSMPTVQSDAPGNVGQQIMAASRVARAHLAAELGISEQSIMVIRAEARTWSDGCLGLGGPAESCLAALVEGYRIEMRAAGKVYAYRTDQTGTSVRKEP